MNGSSDPIACIDIGSSPTATCCYANDLSNPTCTKIFTQEASLLGTACQPGQCFEDCSDITNLYVSKLQQNLTGNGILPILTYGACVNIPAMTRFADEFKGMLPANVTQTLQQYVAPNATDDALRSVTSAVTDCLSSTCRKSRNSNFYYTDHCSPVRLLTNNTSPDLEAINNCLYTLCSNGMEALPWADTDVVGIGVWSSYVIQCTFILFLWLGFVGFALYWHWRGEPARPSETTEGEKHGHFESWIDLLVDFHKAQCYFGATLMIASLTYGIYDVDMLVTFLLVPLATNSILPVIFAYLLILYYRKSSPGCAILTFTVYVLATLVYWTLYRHLASLNGNISDYEIHQQFMFKLSALQAGSGSSALSICPNVTAMGHQQ